MSADPDDALNRDDRLRINALHEAVTFLVMRKPPRDGSGLEQVAKLPEVADVTNRFECYFRTGVLPLDANWRPEES